MAEKPIQTALGPMDRKRLNTLKETLCGEADDSVIRFEGRELLVSQGYEIVEAVEVRLGQRNTRGL